MLVSNHSWCNASIDTVVIAVVVYTNVDIGILIIVIDLESTIIVLLEYASKLLTRLMINNCIQTNLHTQVFTAYSE